MTPVVKSAGGKTRLLPELLPAIGPVHGRYFEPFAGGAAVFFAIGAERSVLSDANADLIATYRALVEDVDGVIAHLSVHRDEHSKAHYYATRSAFNDRTWGSSTERAAAFLCLNHACFNGLWRVNAAGEMNVPIGSYARPSIPDEAALRSAAAALARSELRSGDYRDAVADAVEGDVAFFDPPYDGTFTGYTPTPFGPAEQAELAFTARTLAARGVRVVVSNADTPRIRALYAGCAIEVVSCRRNMAAHGGARRREREVIVVMPGRAEKAPGGSQARSAGAGARTGRSKAVNALEVKPEARAGEPT